MVADSPHRRLNLLTGEWVLVSPHRTKRPWLGAQEKVAEERVPYDPNCYLCPGNKRVTGEVNPAYTSTFVFQNDFSALLPGGADDEWHFQDGVLQAESVTGESRVLCFSPHHNLTLPQLSEEQILDVVNLWSDQTKELGAKYAWVQVFENKGEVMGCSNPHPHGQVWASSSIPTLPNREDEEQRRWFAETGEPLLESYLRQELKSGERVVVENDHWVWLVPFWATWPFEVLLLPKAATQRLPDLNKKQRKALAEILKKGLSLYDALFDCSFPYSMGWHGAPYNGLDNAHWTLHAHFFPPLLRSASVKKFMVGYEMLAEAQRDLTPEQAAERLRSASA